MGVVSQHMATNNRSLLSFESWSQQVRDAVQAVRLLGGKRAAPMTESTVSAVELLLHFPDYVGMAKKLNFNSEQLTGLSRAHQIRIVSDANTGKSHITYKEDVRVNGYFPRATQPDKRCEKVLITCINLLFLRLR